MPQAAFLCSDSPRSAGAMGAVLAPTASIFAADGEGGNLVQACRQSGFTVGHVSRLDSLQQAGCVVLGDTILLDCERIAPADYPALARLDERATRAGAKVVAVASEATLDAAFGCLSGAQVQFLVDPRPGDIALALVLTMPAASGSRVREMDEVDRWALLRLTEEVGKIAARLDTLALPLGGEGQGAMSARLASPGVGYRGPGDETGQRRTRAPLPDPRLIHQIIRQRRLRSRFFESELFADPAWDILLDLTAARAEHRRVCVTSLCIAAAVPATTALRWIQHMTQMGLLKREQDPEDKRRAFIVLTDPVADAMARYFDELGRDAAKLI